MKCSIILCLLLLVLLPAASGARTWLIDDAGTGDAPTVQAGIDSAAAADTVLLANGTYTGAGNRDIDFDGKAIVVRSQSGNPNACVIDCEGSSGDPHRGFVFNSGETTASVLERVLVTGGYIDDGGGAICHHSSPTIDGCVFTGNTSSDDGGAIDFLNSSSLITNCLFLSNEALSTGGAVHTETSGPTFSGCTFNSNTAANLGGAMQCFSNSPEVIECTFSNNSGSVGGAIFLSNCDASLSYCLFHGNSSDLEGAALKCNSSSATLENCTFVADSSGTGGGVVVVTSGGTPGFTNTLIAFSRRGRAVACEGIVSVGFACCNIYGNEGGDWAGCIAVHAGVNGNMSSDPLFCNIPSGDLTLEGCSPCLGGNNTCGVDIGARGQGCGCGEATEPTSWGSIKAMYR